MKKKQEKKISVIIPVYNTHNELRMCLDSIINQMYTQLEIICVDDGSTDGSEKIVDEYALKDARVVVIHQSNHGESNARNVGLQRATGQYVTFCDCDDWLDLDMYQMMITAMEENDVDLVATSWYKEMPNESVIIGNVGTVQSGVFGRSELLWYLYRRDSYRGFAYIWNKLYKREVLYDNKGKLILFDETLQLGGDVVYLAEIALNVSKVLYIDKAFYHYNQRITSGCHTTNLKKLRDWVKAYEIVIQRFEQEEIDKQVVDYVKRFLAYHSFNFAQEALKQSDEKYLCEFQYFMSLYKVEYVALNREFPQRIEAYQKMLEEQI